MRIVFSGVCLAIALFALACSGNTTSNRAPDLGGDGEEAAARAHWFEVGLSKGYDESQVECAWDALRPEKDLIEMDALAAAWGRVGLGANLNRPLGEKVSACGIR